MRSKKNGRYIHKKPKNTNYGEFIPIKFVDPIIGDICLDDINLTVVARLPLLLLAAKKAQSREKVILQEDAKKESCYAVESD